MASCARPATTPATSPTASRSPRYPSPTARKLTFSTEKDDKGNLIPVDANLCIECHQGRESTVTVNNAIAAAKPKSDDEVVLKADGKTPALSFRNVHYFAAGATLFGDAAQGAYQYDEAEV